MKSVAEYAELAARLEDWYWRHGKSRQEPYGLPIDNWLREIHEARRTIERLEVGASNPRPSMAIWGPSQTGKSTLVSAYMDSNATFEKDPAVDGQGSSLHWEGGIPFFFMAPRTASPEEFPPYMSTRVLNPFRRGMDGSSCLSRFTAGTLSDEPNRWKVEDPQFPVQLHLVNPGDLWHALARGYSSECVSPTGTMPKRWDLPRLQELVRKFVRTQDGKPPPQDRRAFERLAQLTEVLDDLAASDDPTYADLAQDLDEWHTFLSSLFNEPHLVGSEENVFGLAEKILWEGSTNLTVWSRKMFETYDRLLGPDGPWHGKKLLCSLEATALFLNMGASQLAYDPPDRNPDSPNALIQNLIRKLGYAVADDVVRIGCDEKTRQALAATADDFSILQGMVWELVIPVNLKNLDDHAPGANGTEEPNPFKAFITEGDMLDFPGVGNETKSLDRRIIVDDKTIAEVRKQANAPDATPQDKARVEKCFNEKLFFMEILKRGKTASIVATYGKRLNIDAFSIFQGIRGYACPNADQLINGVKSWWRHLAPEYYRERRGSSPFPLNLVMTWWAKQLNLTTNPNSTDIFNPIEDILRNLGVLRDPNVVTTFAIHDHKSPDRDQAEIKQDFSPGSQRYENLKSIPEFQHQFQKQASSDSFDTMLQEKETGGANYFFQHATEQLIGLADREDGRTVRARERLEQACERIAESTAWPQLIPAAQEKDDRRDIIEAFIQKLRGSIDAMEEEALIETNAFLRELLNIRATDILLPQDRKEAACTDYVARQFDNWVAAHSRRMPEQKRFSAISGELGLTEPNEVRDLLQALALSTAPDHESICEWFRQVDSRSMNTPQPQTLRLLSLRMGNALVYSGKGVHTATEAVREKQQLQGRDSQNGAHPAYKYFVEPLVAPGGQLDFLAQREVRARPRPDLEGDPEIRALAEQYGLVEDEPEAAKA
ncbi:MAG: hypothetical protein ACFBZ8_12195 [Opitutales bacterium]